MLTKETAVMLAKYNNWADQVLFAAIQKQLPPGAVYQPRTTLFKSMMGTLNHNHQVDLIWRAHLLEEDHGFSTRRDLLYPKFDELVEKQLEVNQWYIDWASRQDGESFSKRSKFNYVNGTPAEMTLGARFKRERQQYCMRTTLSSPPHVLNPRTKVIRDPTLRRPRPRRRKALVAPALELDTHVAHGRGVGKSLPQEAVRLKFDLRAFITREPLPGFACPREPEAGDGVVCGTVLDTVLGLGAAGG
ncbi:hypothetical protein Landi51_10164 [Colletotrichum acutatum]